MKNIYLKIWPWLAVLPLTGIAQPATNSSNYNYNNSNSRWTNDDSMGPHEGSFEFTLSGSGTSNRRLNNSVGGANASFGSYLNSATEVLLRQEADYVNPSPGKQQWNGSTKIALDQHILPSGPVRPFVGVNFGGVYGKRVVDSWVAGLEAGLKFYTLPHTFLFAQAEYDWFFRHAHGVLGRSKFNNGEWNWGLGVGFNL